MKPLSRVFVVVQAFALSIGSGGPVVAAIVDPSKSRCDPVLVGNSSGHDQGNAYHVALRDVGNQPKAGVTVSLRFVGSAAQPYRQQEAGSTVDCVAHTITRIADAQGEATFFARFAGFDNSGVVQVRGQGVLIRSILVRSTDINGDGATDLRDLSLFRQRFLFDPAAPETDFDQSGRTGVSDLVLMREEFFTGAHGDPCP